MDEVNVFKLQTMVQKTKDQIETKIKSVVFKLEGHLLWDRPWEARLWHHPQHWHPQS